jgi:nitrogenase-associated protein
MTHVVFYEKPGCGGNAKQKAWLESAGHTLDVRSLLAWPWTADSLLAFLAPLPVAEWFNRAAPRVKSGEVVPEQLDRDTALALLLAEPLLIRRPLMEADGRKLVGFEPNAVAAWLDSPSLAELDGRRTEGCAANISGRSVRRASSQNRTGLTLAPSRTMGRRSKLQGTGPSPLTRTPAILNFGTLQFSLLPADSVIGTGLRLRLNLDQDTQLDSCTHRKLLDDFVDDVSKLLRGSILMGKQPSRSVLQEVFDCGGARIPTGCLDFIQQVSLLGPLTTRRQARPDRQRFSPDRPAGPFLVLPQDRRRSSRKRGLFLPHDAHQRPVTDGGDAPHRRNGSRGSARVVLVGLDKFVGIVDRRVLAVLVVTTMSL